MLVPQPAHAPAITIPNVAVSAPGYIRSQAFDSGLLAAPLVVGLAAATVAIVDPRLFPLLLLADLWLLGYHHVIATYTRLAFTRSSLRENRFLAIDLLVLVTTASIGVTLWFGYWVITSAFLYLQWFHYMRQGYGIGRMYYRTTPAGAPVGARDLVTDAVMYIVPIYGIAHRSATMGTTFLGLPVARVVLPDSMIVMLGAAAAIAVAVWALRTTRDAVRGELDGRYAMFTLSHIVIFLWSYVIVDDVNVGWLGVNIWHNMQYVMVVWMVNAKRYAGGIDPQARFLSRISQPDRVRAYFATTLAISTVVYFNLDMLTTALVGSGFAAAVAVYMGINFHHYVVDAMIWKRRRVPITPV